MGCVYYQALTGTYPFDGRNRPRGDGLPPPSQGHPDPGSPRGHPAVGLRLDHVDAQPDAGGSPRIRAGSAPGVSPKRQESEAHHESGRGPAGHPAGPRARLVIPGGASHPARHSHQTDHHRSANGPSRVTSPPWCEPPPASATRATARGDHRARSHCCRPRDPNPASTPRRSKFRTTSRPPTDAPAAPSSSPPGTTPPLRTCGKKRRKIGDHRRRLLASLGDPRISSVEPDQGEQGAASASRILLAEAAKDGTTEIPMTGPELAPFPRRRRQRGHRGKAESKSFQAARTRQVDRRLRLR